VSAMLAVRRLTKAFQDDRPAVDDVSFEVEAGEIVVLLGPSGCGKTTTLRSVAGLETPTSGVIEIGGDVVSDPGHGINVKPQHREVGMVFQSYAVWPHMTVRENVAYPLKHRRLSSAEIGKRVKDALDLVNLSEYAQRSVVALSGGQMQRVALARSLVYHPRLLLLDEPLSNLDAKLRLRLRDDLRRIIKAANVTALYVTHDQSEAVALGDRVAVMRDGRLLQIAPPVDLYNAPADPFVAEFTGATNSFAGRAIEGGTGTIRVALADGIEFKARSAGTVAAGSAVRIAVRPENTRLEAPDAISARPDWNALEGRINALRYQGTQTAYDVTVGASQWEVIETGTRPHYAAGSRVVVRVAAEACWAFSEPATHQGG